MAAVKTAVVTQTEILDSPYNKPTTLPPPPPRDPILGSHKDGSVEDSGRRPAFRLEEHPIDQIRPIKVGVIGGGLSGITAGILLPAKLPGLDLRIYDKNADLVRYLPTLLFFWRLFWGLLIGLGRAGRGMRIRTPGCDVISQRMSTSRTLSRIPAGRRSLPRAMRSGITGRGLRGSMMCISMCGHSSRWSAPSGLRRRGSGGLLCEI